MNFHTIVAPTTLGVVRVDWYVIHNPKGQITAYPAPNSQGTDTLKDQIFKSGMEMANANSPVLLKGVIKVPKKWQKIGRDDKIVLVYKFVDNTVNACNACVHCLYREYR